MAGKRGFRLVALGLTLLVALCAFAPFAMALEAKVNKSVNMRAGAGTEFDKLDKLRKGDVVTVLENTSGQEWWKVSFQGVEGYVSSEYLEIIRPPAQPGYATRNTQMRAGMGTQFQSMQAIPINSAVSVLDTEDKSWWLVKYENQEGYVQSATLKLGEAPTNASSGGTDNTVKANDANAKKIQDAKSINKDTVGWVNIPNTNIDAPILYRDNFYYNNYNIYKKKSLEGVYPYVNRLTRNVVIFGHNLRGSNRGFHQLHHLQEAAAGRSTCQYGKCGRSISGLSGWCTTKAGRTWNISIFGKSQWEVFAMYEVPRNEPISTLQNNWNPSPANMSKWLEGQLKRSEVNFGVSVSEKDQIMTIITCGTNYDSASANSRLFVFLKNVG